MADLDMDILKYAQVFPRALLGTWHGHRFGMLQHALLGIQVPFVPAEALT